MRKDDNALCHATSRDGQCALQTGSGPGINRDFFAIDQHPSCFRDCYALSELCILLDLKQLSMNTIDECEFAILFSWSRCIGNSNRSLHSGQRAAIAYTGSPHASKAVHDAPAQKSRDRQCEENLAPSQKRRVSIV
jgi:hypothetical protein